MPPSPSLNDTLDALIKVGWARPDSGFRRVFTSLMIPNATEEQHTWLDEAPARVHRRGHRAQARAGSGCPPTPLTSWTPSTSPLSLSTRAVTG